ncbi:recombination regulator RecX [Streptococcus pacificus]|uniref:Regulatory protein RecX n=1 Tax=Streptococcus pacificus TaxID=2740577 RepID=A0ABS0ZIF8_9STRE|nr:recombination regulator RecX [Streptococcus pacificus]MBJ8325778.1 recombination regulator RecX [Streptococcus pacificus]
MKISRLEKKKRLYLLELDKKEQLYITEDTIVRFMLTKNKEIDDKTLEAIKTFAQFSHGKNIALYFLSFKLRTEKEVTDYLLKHDIEKNSISNIIQQLKEENWLNDQKYSETFIEQSLRSGDKGPYILTQKLKQKGLDEKIISQTLEQYDFTEVAQRTAQKLLRKHEGRLPVNALKEKITQSLVTKGFSYTDAKAAFDTLIIEDDDENDNALIEKELDKQYRKYSRRYDGYELKQKLTQALARKGFDYDTIKTVLRDYLD